MNFYTLLRKVRAFFTVPPELCGHLETVDECRICELYDEIDRLRAKVEEMSEGQYDLPKSGNFFKPLDTERPSKCMEESRAYREEFHKKNGTSPGVLDTIWLQNYFNGKQNE
jgi:hypothetical protein